MMRVLSLFSGIGGIDIGLERAGMQVVELIARWIVNEETHGSEDRHIIR